MDEQVPIDSNERERLIVRGWELQRAEAENDEQREFCDWMIGMVQQRRLNFERGGKAQEDMTVKG